LTTNTKESAIREASLTVDANDWRPVEEKIQLEDGARIEVSEVLLRIGASEPILADDVKSKEREVSPEGLLASEVDVRAALHEIGADLGEPWEIERSSDGLIVRGTLSSGEKLAAARERLSRIPHVTEQLQGATAATPAGFIAPDDPPVTGAASTAEPLLLD